MLATRDPLLRTEKFTDARSKLSLLFDLAVKHELPVIIQRAGREQGLLVARASVRRLLAQFTFHADVMPEDDGTFTLWLRELDIGGTGRSVREARDDLVSATHSYVRDYWQQFDFYRHLPDMSAKEPYVLRLSLADTEQELLDVLFGSAPTSATPPVPIAVPA